MSEKVAASISGEIKTEFNVTSVAELREEAERILGEADLKLILNDSRIQREGSNNRMVNALMFGDPEGPR